MVGRDDVPRRMLCGSSANRLFVRRLIVVPALPFLEILGVEFPILFGLFEPLEKPLFLFLFRDVQEELPDEHAVSREILLDVADVLESMLPQFLSFKSAAGTSVARGTQGGPDASTSS